MADYRQWCHSCGNEIGFGGHAAGCEAQERARKAEKDRRDWEEKMFDALRELSDDELVEALVELELRYKAWDQELKGCEKQILAIKDYSRRRSFSILERAREELKERG